MAWAPSPEGALQVVALIKAALDPTNPEAHQAALHQLEHFSQTIPDFCCYLTVCLSKGHEHGDEVRRIAGLRLKHCLRTPMDPAQVAFMKAELASVLSDPSREIRRTAAIAVTALVSMIELTSWPELMPGLVQLLDSGSHPHMDGALCALELISEDHTEALAAQEQVMVVLIPKLLNLFTNQSGFFRQVAVHCLNQFLFPFPPSLVASMGNFIEGLLQLHMDTNVEVRKRVCQAIVMIVEIRVEYLLPRLGDIIQRLMWTTENDPEYDVRKEACEFWSSVVESDAPKETLMPYIPKLIPVLLNGMHYSEDELAILDCEDDNAAVADREQDINPARLAYKGRHHQEEPDSDDDDDDDDDDDESEGAAGLDVVSGKYQDVILEALLAPLHEKLNSQDWLAKESAILAAGAVATGCTEGLISKGYLMPLLDHLIKQMMGDPKPLVRSITCWTLSRYSKFICAQPPETCLQPVVEGLLRSILDRNKKVQEAACSAFATLEEEARHLLTPYLHVILQTLCQAFEVYQSRNLLVLYDAVGSLADSCGAALNNPQYIEILIPTLIKRWNAIQDADRGIFPLLECLTSVVQALGPGFTPFAPPVYQRCVALMKNTLALQHAQQPVDEADDEYVVCSLDLISGLAEGLGSGVDSLVQNSELPPMLLHCCSLPSSEIRQSAFALVGDLAKAAIVHLRPHLPQLLPLLTMSLQPHYISVCNNAAWAIGEIAVRVQTEMKDFVPAMLPPLMAILQLKDNTTKSLTDNTAITICRLAFAAPDVVSENLGNFVQPLCATLAKIRDDVEKADAFNGLIILVQTKPQAVVESFDFICGAFVSWGNPAAFAAVHQQMATLLQWFKTNLEAQNLWTVYYGRLPAETKTALAQRFGVN